jgi:hypothetical protein
MVSVMDLILSALGEGTSSCTVYYTERAQFLLGWAYVVLGALCVAVAPLMYLEVRMGPVWRQRRAMEVKQK